MSLVLVLSPTLTNQGSTETSESRPDVTSTPAQSRLSSPDPVLPQHWSDQDYCFLVSVIGVKPRQLHQMADSTNPSLGGRVIQWYYLWVIPKITGGFRVIAPFTLNKKGICFVQIYGNGVHISYSGAPKFPHQYLYHTIHCIKSKGMSSIFVPINKVSFYSAP